MIKQYLEFVHPAKTLISLLILSFVVVIDLAIFGLNFLRSSFSSLKAFLWGLGLLGIVFSSGCIINHTIVWKGFDLPFPLAGPQETIDGKWEHCLGHEYYFGLFPMLILSYAAGGWQLCLVLVIGFAIGMRRGWNYNEMWKKINKGGKNESL